MVTSKVQTLGRLLSGVLAAAFLTGSAWADDVCGERDVTSVGTRSPSLRQLTTRDDHVRAFDDELRVLARLLDLPGLVVAVAENGKIVHQLELGHADIDRREAATVDRLFWTASVTKTFTATLIMQMVDEGLVDLDDPMIEYWLPSFFQVRITPEYRLRHVLGHTAQGTPGRTFVYNGGRYGFCYGVFEKVGGLALKERLIQRILVPLKLESTMPGIGDSRYKHLRGRLVTPYRYDETSRKHIKALDVLEMGDLFASSGIASSAVDLVRYAHALDTGELMSAGAGAKMTEPASSTDGHTLPYGVGWFVQNWDGEKLVWHYGYGAADSALLVRVPGRQLTLVVLANSDRLSASGMLGDGNLLTSPAAISFLKHFVSQSNSPLASPDYDGAVDETAKSLEELRRRGASAIDFDEVFAQALARDFLGRRDPAQRAKSLRLLEWLRQNAPERLRRADLATLTLLSRQSDKRLLDAAGPLLETLLAREPENPGVLEAAVQFHDKSGRDGEAIKARKRLASLTGYEDDLRKQESALWLGEHFGREDPKLGLSYLWNAETWWYNSGNGGDLGRRATRAIDDIRHARRGATKAAAREALRPLATSAVQTQKGDRSLNASGRAAIIDGVVAKIAKVYVYPDVAAEMEKAIRDHQAKKDYDQYSNIQEFVAVLSRHLREVSKDNHLGVDIYAGGVPFDADAVGPPDPQAVEEFRQSGVRSNFAFRKVERLDGGVGLLQVDGFYPAEWITETASGAMAFLANSESIIIDLRQNSGGQSGGTLLCSYFFKEETHLTDFYNRPANTTRQVWSFPVSGAAKFADKDLYILTSRRTFSAAEAMAYDLQALKRATIVGEVTGGGAHGTTIYRITDRIGASIPFCRGINPITKTDWEGRGVTPDVAVPADQALLSAHLMALRKALKKNAGAPGNVEKLKRAIVDREKELEALRAK